MMKIIVVASWMMTSVVCSLKMNAPSREAVQKSTALTTSSATAVFALYEMKESLFEIGHSHGLMLLSLSKLAHAGALAGTAGKEAVEEGKLYRLRGVCKSIITVRRLRILAAIALLAAGCEVYSDLKPSGHHGTALLALAELRETTETAMKKTSAPLIHIITSCWTKLTLGIGAFYCAACELRHSFHIPGAHHGVAIMALSLTIKALGEVTTVLVHNFYPSSFARRAELKKKNDHNLKNKKMTPP